MPICCKQQPAAPAAAGLTGVRVTELRLKFGNIVTARTQWRQQEPDECGVHAAASVCKPVDDAALVAATTAGADSDEDERTRSPHVAPRADDTCAAPPALEVGAPSAAAALPTPPPASASDFGRTFFSRLSLAWSRVVLTQPEGDFELASFIAACHALSAVYDRLGGFLGPAKKDLLGILATLQSGTRALPHVGTVQDAVRHDMAHGLTFGENRNRKGVSFNVLWLSRALRFILFLLENMTDGAFAGKETKDAAREAYSRSIKPFHGMLLSNVFGTMMGQVPSRKKFIENLAEGRTAEEVYAEMAAFVRISGPMVAALHDFLCQNGLDHPWKA